MILKSGQRCRWIHPGTRSLKKVVKVLYPDCAKMDCMTRTEYRRWKASDWPPGTRVWIEGVRVR